MSLDSDVKFVRESDLVKLHLSEFFKWLGEEREVRMIVVEPYVQSYQIVNIMIIFYLPADIFLHSLLSLHPFVMFLTLAQSSPTTMGPDQSIHIEVGKFTIIKECTKSVNTSRDG